MTGTIEGPPRLFRPRKSPRKPRLVRAPDPRPRCPYCLEFFPLEILENWKEGVCPLCRHPLVVTLLTTPVHLYSRAQQWMLMANEMEFIWQWGRRDLDIYLFSQGEFYNPDYMEAKDRWMELYYAKEKVLGLREVFLEAEGEFDLLIAGYLERSRPRDGGLAREILQWRPWRGRARALTREYAGGRPVTEFQLGMVKALDCAVYGGWEGQGEVIRALEARMAEYGQDWEGLGNP